MGITANVLKHSLIYSGANAIGKVASLILLPFYAHIFDTEGYGVIAMADSAVGLLGMVFGSAMVNGLMRIYHAHGGQPEYQAKVVSTAMAMAWVGAGGLVVIPIVFAGPLSTLLFGSSAYGSVLPIALMAFVVGVGNQVCDQVFVIQQRSLTVSLIGLSRVVIGISLNILLVIVMKVGVTGIFVSSLVTALTTGIVAHSIVLRRTGFLCSRSAAKELAATWFPLVPGEVVSYLGRQAERVFARFLLGLEAVGVLEMAYKFPPLLVHFVTRPFNLAWRTKSFEIAKQENGPAVMGQMFTTMMFLVVFIGLLLFVNIDPLLKLLTPESFWRAALITRIEIGTTILSAATYYFLFGILYVGKTWTISYIKIAMTPAKILLSGGLIYIIGLEGAALSALLIQVFTLLWVIKVSQAEYRIPIEVKHLTTLTVAAAFVVLSVELIGDRAAVILHASMVHMVEVFVSILTGAPPGDTLNVFLDSKGFQIGRLLANSILASGFGLVIFYIRPGIVHEIKGILRKRAKV